MMRAFLLFCGMNVALMTSGAGALPVAEQAAVDKYIQAVKSDSSSLVFRKALEERVAELEKRLSVTTSELARLGPQMQRRLAAVQDSIKIYQSPELNLYNDNSWRDYLVKATTPFCCDQMEIATNKALLTSLAGKTPRQIAKQFGRGGTPNPEKEAMTREERQAARKERKATRGGGKSADESVPEGEVKADTGNGAGKKAKGEADAPERKGGESE